MKPTHIDELRDIGRRINECFLDVKTNMTTDDLDRFDAYINEQEVLMPLLQPTKFRDGGSGAMTHTKERIAALRVVCACP